ncbi:MAG: NAD-glutamate dehydrogenase [Alphaproteobacteria bacterium]|nr:NAD-glutamate dehydrogenase [Alphaproteobacteria bacterium]MBU0794091.1 NAD-glutamate dehydrogenase [Alphaproteobacteria bacterium]MBU0875445.1 NAD-glutamate dehydrogenase [Alphaproteobacteria bacterium]MBU1771428.1 NAD-glutamate dehydrogenase [Alphaproteobacteria bacterium]
MFMSTKTTRDEALVAAIANALTHGVLENELQSLEPGKWDDAARFVLQAAATRQAGESAILVDSVTDERDSATGSRRQRIALINADMPFLVDSIANCLSQADLVIHLLAHPILPVQRDESGRLKAIADEDGAARESFIYIETDRVDARGRRELERALEETLSHVRAAVGDWRAMIDALNADANRLGAGEGGDFLRWLLKGNLTQLGHELWAPGGKTSRQKGICRVAKTPVLSDHSAAAALAWFEAGHAGPLILKSNMMARVHRHVLIDLLLVPVREEGKITALSIHAGLWTSAALATRPDDVPMLRDTLSGLMARFGYNPSGHAAKSLVHALTALPHDLMMAFSAQDRDRITLAAMSLADRPRPKLELVSDVLGRHLFAFVWMMRDDLSTSRRESISALIGAAAHASLLGWSIALEESGLALVRFTFDLRDEGHVPDAEMLDRQIALLLRGWTPAVEQGLIELGETSRAAVLAQRYAPTFPMSYRESAGPDEAAKDVLALHQLTDANQRSVRFYRIAQDGDHQLRVKIYSLEPLVLSEAVPAFENFGFRVLEERSTSAGTDGSLGHIQRFTLERQDGGPAAAVLDRAAIVSEALDAVLEGRAENDRFAELIVTAQLGPRDIVFLRAIFRYLRQTGLAYGLSTVVDALRREAHITRKLVDLFFALHDPERSGDSADAAGISAAIDTALEGVKGLDEDRILRLYRAVISATLRTNAFMPAAQEALAFKIDSAQVPGLPKPLPWREIWVYSPRVEGIHLRTGRVARGGLRWSDRRDDFRTEVLGLMKAQRVKNAVIVPTGAKGGFYPKMLPNPASDRDAWLAEGTESYRIFIRALLSVTDNIVKGKVAHPKSMVIRDGADPYFVVAADKGTASFSDVANAIAIERDFWLGDAFASGGSNGYDHKAMGITARGAWISVQRHFAEMGVDVQKDPVRVIGVGDMSGDVFGNGMLLSKSIRLVAAFDHRHIFIDPDPDAATSWKERQRLFKLPRSSWADYKESLISKGGGVFARSEKSITLTPEMQALVGTDQTAMEPTALISALLRAEADLIWFGGIGTYIKAANQNNAEVGDTANDRLRVDAEDVRAKVIGEGANLGVTQAGRIAYALRGGRINTDFIDNSAGVDCSDNEVNIKIALNKEVAEGRLTQDARNDLLRAMTDEVAELVLEDNRLQALGLSIAERGGRADLASYVHLIHSLENGGHLDRRVEGLAPDQELMRRAGDGQGLTRPELAVLFSTAKLAVQDAIEKSDLARDNALESDLFGAFPAAMQAREADAIAAHQLRSEIIATKVANRMVNRLGVILPFALTEEASCSLDEIAHGFVIAERLFDVRQLWDDIDQAVLSEEARLTLYRSVANAMAGHIGDAHRSLPTGIPPHEAIEMLDASIDILKAQVDGLLQAEPLKNANAMKAVLSSLGVPDDLAERTVMLVKMDGAIGLALLARKSSHDELAVASAFTRLGEALGIDWLQALAAQMTPNDPWERLLVAGSARELQQMRLGFLARAGSKTCEDHLERWLAKNGNAVEKFREFIARARQAPSPSAAMVAELTGQARTLLSR